MKSAPKVAGWLCRHVHLEELPKMPMPETKDKNKKSSAMKPHWLAKGNMASLQCTATVIFKDGWRADHFSKVASPQSSSHAKGEGKLLWPQITHLIAQNYVLIGSLQNTKLRYDVPRKTSFSGHEILFPGCRITCMQNKHTKKTKTNGGLPNIK